MQIPGTNRHGEGWVNAELVLKTVMKMNRTNFLGQPLARSRPASGDTSARSGHRTSLLAKVLAASQALRLRTLLVVVSLAVLVAGSLKAGNTVINNTSKTIRKQINGRPWVTLHPGESDNAPNDTDNGANVMTLRIQTVDSALDYFAIVQLPPDGTARVEEEDRSRMGLPPNLYCVTETASGADYDVSNYGVQMNRRNVRFVLSGDCQFENPGDSASSTNRKLNAEDVNRLMVSRCTGPPYARGIVYAGDLTQFDTTPFWRYTSSFGDSDNLRFVFDGLGNHDYDDREPNGAPNVDNLAHVANHPHSTGKTLKDSGGRPHYSWDWGDVHFVQLNLFPGNAPSGVGEFAEIDPLFSFDFLVRDLANFVGNSGRPVVLIHHYPPGNGSASDNQWRDYWNALANYNVIAIFAGHEHPDASNTNTFKTWTRAEAGGTGGPDEIPYFICGAAMGNEHWTAPEGDPDRHSDYRRGEGAFLDVLIDDCRLYVRRFNNFDVLQYETFIPLRRTAPLYLESDYIGIGGGTRVAPYNKVGNAMSALACATNAVDLKFSGGTYLEGRTLKINRPLRLLPRTQGQSATIKP